MTISPEGAAGAVTTPQLIAFGEDSYPALGQAAGRASRMGRRSYFRLAQADLLLLLLGALTATLAPYVGNVSTDTLRAVSASFLAVGFIAKATNRIRHFDQEWFDGRAVAESVKTTSWRYMMHVSPFDGDDDSAELTLLDSLREVMAGRPALPLTYGDRPDEARQITDEMRQVRALPLNQRRQVFLHDRVNDQIRWYAGRATMNGRRAVLWFWVGLMAQSGAIALTILGIVVAKGPDFTAVVAAVAATATAWTQLGRHDELNRSYGMAAQELILLKPLVERAANQQAFATAVADVESAISRESTMWAAKRG